MTLLSNSPALSGSNAGQSSLPFSDSDLLAVRLRPSEFARAVGVSKQCVSLWIKNEKVTLGADGRLNPQAAMRQLLRTENPGRIRARLFRQAFADMADLRAHAARSLDLEQQLAACQAQRLADENDSNLDYEKMDRWIFEFERRIADLDIVFRGQLDADAWRAYVGATLSRVMAEDDELDEIAVQAAADLGITARNEAEEGAEVDSFAGHLTSSVDNDCNLGMGDETP